jgi:hypothetical protein
MLTLDFDRHKNLFEKCLSGDINLFTGAGFSMGGTINTRPIPSTWDLTNSLLTEFAEIDDPVQIKRLKKKKNFQGICEYVIKIKTEHEFNEYLTSCFKNCTPADFHYSFNRINWKNIFTTNVDDIIESVFKNTQTKLQVFNTKRMTQDYKGENILKYYKLHGDVNNKSEGFIFLKNQYLNTVVDEKFNFPILKFSELLYIDTFCFIGTSFDEIDIEKYIVHFHKQNSQHLPKHKIYYIAKDIYEEEIVELEARNIIPIQATAEMFITKLLEYKEIKENSSKLKIIKKISTNELLEKMGFECINNKSLNLSKEEVTIHKPIDFYLGYSPKWIDIASSSDAIFSYTKNIIEKIEDSKNFQLFVTIGKSGNGKTTSFKRILYNFSNNNDYIVIEHKYLDEINNNVVNDLVKIINREPKHLIIGIDNGSWSFKFIEQIYTKVKQNIRVSFVITSRYPEYYRERTYISGLPNITNYIDDNLTFENAEKVIEVLDEKGYLGKLAKSPTKKERITEFLSLKNNNKDLFTSLIYATKGRGFFDRINMRIDETLQKNDINIKLLLLLALLDKFGSIGLNKSIFYNAFKDEIDDLNILLNSIGDILDKNFQNTEFIKIRGEYVTNYIFDNIFKYVEKEYILSTTSKLLMYITTLYDIDKRKKRNYKTEVSSLLLNSRNYFNYLNINDKKSFDDFYNILKDYYKDVAPFWLYYAKMEMKLNALDSAWIHLDQAKALNSSYEIEHTIGQWYLINARSQSSYIEAKKEFSKGEEIMIKQINMNRDAYPVHTYIDEFMFFSNKYKENLNPSIIKKLVKIINNARKEFSEQVIIQIIWKKFYHFLKKVNLASYMVLGLEDLSLMDKIDVTKSAEEQYKILLKDNKAS